MDSLSLHLVRSIHDPVHGSIKLSNLEMQVIEHPLFSRLHNVRQNSFLYKVFPSAKHTRFEHSIGVMHMAHKMLTAAIENGGIAEQRGDIVRDEESLNQLLCNHQGVALNLYASNVDVLKRAFKELRLAALLHDIGHGPLSHLFDAFAPTCDQFKEILRATPGRDSSDILESIEKMVDGFLDREVAMGRGRLEARVEHEHVSSYFAYRILSKIGADEATIRNVLTILKRELELGKLDVTIHRTEFDMLPLLSELVASAPIDCDRMDYLKRDSYFVGVPYGDYSEDRVLKTLLPYAASDKKLHLGLKQSGLHAVENFLQARYELYVQVYGHKTNEAANAILEFASAGNLEFADWSGIDLSNSNPGINLADEFEKLYTRLSDESFLDTVINRIDLDKTQALEDLKARKLWKRIYEVEEFIEHGQRSNVEAAFEAEFATMNDLYPDIMNFIGDRFPLKDVGSGAKLMEKSSQTVYVVSDKELSVASQIIRSLNRGLRVRRIYSVGQHSPAVLKEYVRNQVDPVVQEAIRRDESTRNTQ